MPLDQVAAPSTLAPLAIAAEATLIEPPSAIVTLTPPAAVTAPPTLAPDPIAAPSLLAPDPPTADPPVFGPPALTRYACTIPYAPTPLPALQDVTGGEKHPPALRQDVLGALAGVSDPDLVAALAALLKVTRDQTAVNLRVLEEMRRKRRATDGRGRQHRDHEWPADVIDYDTAGEILAGLL